LTLLRENVRARKARRIVSLLSCPGNRRQRFCFFKLIEVETKFRSQINFGVFTQPRPTATCRVAEQLRALRLR